ELDQAEPLFQRALGISQQHLGESHPDVAVTLNNLARLYFRRNEYASAGPLLERLLSIKEQALGANHPEIAAILTSLAKVRLHQSDYDGGEAFARRALEIREKLKLPNDLAVATALETLAEINGARGRIEEEIHHRERALEVRTGAMGVDHPLVASARSVLEARRATLTQTSTAGAPREVPAPPVAPPIIAVTVVAAPIVAPPSVPPSAPPIAIQPAALDIEPPSAKPPVSPPPSFTISPPERTTRTSSLPWLDAPEPPVFDRTPSPTGMRNSGSNGTIAMPMHNVNGNGNGNSRQHTNGATHTAPDVHAAESPLAFHPLAEARRASRTPTPATSMTATASIAPEAIDSPAQSPFTNSFARLVAETPGGRSVIANDTPAPEQTHHIEEPRSEISLDWPLEPRRPWLKIFGALAVLVAIAGGGWYFLSRYDARASSLPKMASTSAKKAPLVAAKSDTLLVRHDSTPPGPPASVVKPGVTSQIVPSTKSSGASSAGATPPNDEGSPAEAKNAFHVAAKSAASDDAEPELFAAPKMPNIKVDAITKMIDDSARRRADSVGNAIQQKAPTFKVKAYKPPE
ncbi:MAG: tetratricopeptide repeat protein, partial [Gemmatimonadota bacterium]